MYLFLNLYNQDKKWKNISIYLISFYTLLVVANTGYKSNHIICSTLKLKGRILSDLNSSSDFIIPYKGQLLSDLKNKLIKLDCFRQKQHEMV